MAKLTTDAKIELIGNFVDALFVSAVEVGSVDTEDIAGQAFMAGASKDTGLKMGELPALVKQFGINKGYIQTLEQRRDSYRELCKAYPLEEIVTYGDVITFIEVQTEAHDLTEKWCLDTLGTIMENLGYYVPEKSKLTHWQVAVLKAFRINSKLTPKEMDEIIKGEGIQNYNNYTKSHHGVLYAAFNPEAVID